MYASLIVSSGLVLVSMKDELYSRVVVEYCIEPNSTLFLFKAVVGLNLARLTLESGTQTILVLALDYHRVRGVSRGCGKVLSLLPAPACGARP